MHESLRRLLENMAAGLLVAVVVLVLFFLIMAITTVKIPAQQADKPTPPPRRTDR